MVLDGFNVLTTVEAALAGGIILAARDGCYRDMASVHGSYRKVEETWPAIGLVGGYLAGTGASEVQWYLDRPVSNSGRLKGYLAEAAAHNEWNWSIELVNNPDTVLGQTQRIVVTADSAVLDACHKWFNLAREIVTIQIPHARVLHLGDL
jgi:hypothetical protein